MSPSALTRRLAALVRTGVVVLLVFTVASAASSPGAAKPPRSPRAVTRATAIADAYVRADRPRANFGAARTLRANASPKTLTYIRFAVFAANFERAVLRLYALRASASGVRVRRYRAKWSERTLTFATAPRAARAAIGSGPLERGWNEVDVTSFVRGAGSAVGLALSTSSRTGVALASRERRARAPHLRVVGGVSAPPPHPNRGAVLWRADMEEGTLSDWYFPERGEWGKYGGGEYNSDGGDSTATPGAANARGAWSARQTIAASTSGSSGTRLFRWREPDRHSELYYSAWFLFPKAIALQPRGWFNLMQWKSIRGRNNDSMWAILVGNRPNGRMYLYLAHQPQVRGRTYAQSAVNVPVGKWFRVDAFYRASSRKDGRVIVWQDGRRLVDVDGVATSYDAINGAGNPWSVQWSVNAYGCCLSPTPWTHYVDDASIALPPQH